MEVLRELRRTGIRDSELVCEKGEEILEKGHLKRIKDSEVWAFLEQLAIAAIDCGKLELAKVCVERLDTRFPASPRVAPLKGMLLEGEGKIDMARQYYENELKLNEHNVGIRKRLITLHLQTSQPTSSNAVAGSSKSAAKAQTLSIQRGIEMLVEYLDIVYTDVEAWQQLSETYTELGLYEQSLSCLGDLILLQPWNAIWQLKYAETAYTLGDFALAYRSYLRAIELAGPITESGMSRRAAFGVKLCINKLNDDTASSSSHTALPLHAEAIDALLTKELLDAYSTEWSAPGDKAAGHDEQKAVRSTLSALSSTVPVHR